MKYSKAGWMTFVAAIAVVVLLTAGIPAKVQAQTTGLRFNIPFEFSVGDTVLPGGTYTVWRNGHTGAISVSDGNGHSAVSLTDAVTRKALLHSAVSQLIFNRYKDSYFLREVRWSGYDTARGLPKSGLEAEIAKKMPTGKAIVEGIAAR